MEERGQLDSLATLTQSKSPWYPLDRELGGPQSQSGCDSKEKSSNITLTLVLLYVD